MLYSSKSAAEIIEWQNELGLAGQAFIAENGAVIQLDERWTDSDDFPLLFTGIRHDKLYALLEHLRSRYGFKFTCFGDVDEMTLCEWTGLTRKQAMLAKLAQASENAHQTVNADGDKK